jgi:hypothetical protein
MDAPFRPWQAATTELPTADDWIGGLVWNTTSVRVTYSDGSAWKELQPYSAVLASFGGLAIVQGDLIYGSAANTVARLAKDANATRYLANTGTSNSPAWAQVDLTNGVTGRLPFANIAQLTARSIWGVTGNATADGAAIQGTANQVLRVNGAGTALAFGAIDVSQSAAVSGILAAANGGTANGFTAFSGPATATKTFTLPNASDTIVCYGTAGSFSAAQTFLNSSGIKILDTDASHTLGIVGGSNLTANRTFTITTGDANRVLDMSAGSVTFSAAGIAAANASGSTGTGNLVYSISPAFGQGTAVFSADITGNPIAYKAGAADLVYMSFFARNASPSTRSGWFGYGSGGTTVMTFTNEIGNIVLAPSSTTVQTLTSTSVAFDVPVGLKSYTVGTVPSAATAGQLIYVSNETGGATPAFSDGTNWRRVADRAIIS